MISEEEHLPSMIVEFLRLPFDHRCQLHLLLDGKNQKRMATDEYQHFFTTYLSMAKPKEKRCDRWPLGIAYPTFMDSEEEIAHFHYHVPFVSADKLEPMLVRGGVTNV